SASSKQGNPPPPCAKPVWSSSGPPGAWITPSSDWKREPMILRIDGYSALRSLDPGDVDLAHRHHRFECSPGRDLVRIAVGPQQRTRRDLPRKAPAILAPAAGIFLSAIADDGVPVTVGLFLVVGQDHEADRLIGLEVGSAVQADEPPAEHCELDRELRALRPTRKI